MRMSVDVKGVKYNVIKHVEVLSSNSNTQLLSTASFLIKFILIPEVIFLCY